MTTNNNKEVKTCTRCGLNTDINQGRWTKPLCKVGETTYEQHIFNKELERITEEFSERFGSIHDDRPMPSGLETERKIKDWLRIALTTYADQRVREERERIIKCLPETSLIDAYPREQKIADIEKAIIHQIKSIISNPPRQ